MPSQGSELIWNLIHEKQNGERRESQAEETHPIQGININVSMDPRANAPTGRADRVLVKTGADKGF
jgi:hypothetical protein